MNNYPLNQLFLLKERQRERERERERERGREGGKIKSSSSDHFSHGCFPLWNSLRFPKLMNPSLVLLALKNSCAGNPPGCARPLLFSTANHRRQLSVALLIIIAKLSSIFDVESREQAGEAAAIWRWRWEKVSNVAEFQSIITML